MGGCASCLGLGRRSQNGEHPEASHLLASDQYHDPYGATGQHMGTGFCQPDPEEIRRQRDALERICAQTSDKLIDVLQPAHPDERRTPGEYYSLFIDHFPAMPRPGDNRSSSSATAVDVDEATWLAEIAMAHGDVEDWDHVNVIEPGSLTVQFDDALGLDHKSAPSPVMC